MLQRILLNVAGVLLALFCFLLFIPAVGFPPSPGGGSNVTSAATAEGYNNLLAHPECEVEFQGPPAPYRAELLTGDERAAAWATIVDFYAGYDRYRAKCAPREIRVFRLRPA